MRPPSLPRWLARREGGALVGPPFPSPPLRLCVPVRKLVDATQTLLATVLLGFSADGEHLFSYRCCAGGEYVLYIWAYRQPAVLLATVPLFREATEAGGRQESFGAALVSELSSASDARRTEENEHAPLSVTVCEAGKALGAWKPSSQAPSDAPPVVHGCEADVGADCPSTHRVTVVLAPWLVKRGTPLVATHVAVPAHAPQPFTAAVCLVDDMLVLPLGDGLLALAVGSEGEAVEGACTTLIEWAGLQPASQPSDAAETAAQSISCAVLRRFDAEAFLGRALAPTLDAGWRLTDYAMQLVLSHPAGPASTALVLLMAQLQPSKGSLGPPQLPPRLVALLVNVACSARRDVMLQMREQKPLPAGAPPATLCTAAAALAAALRRSAQPVRVVHAVSNVAAVQTGLSAAALRHPSLPLAILGFEAGGE